MGAWQLSAVKNNRVIKTTYPVVKGVDTFAELKEIIGPTIKSVRERYGKDIYIVAENLKMRYTGQKGAVRSFTLGPRGNAVYLTTRETVSSIPIEEGGYVKVSFLAEQHNNRPERSRRRDEKRNAKRTLPQNLTPAQATVWMHNMSKYDIKGIDGNGKVNYVPKKRIHVQKEKIEKAITEEEYLRSKDNYKSYKMSKAEWKDIIIPYLDDCGATDYTKGHRRTYASNMTYAYKLYHAFKKNERGMR